MGKQRSGRNKEFSLMHADMPSGWRVTWPLVVLLVPLPSSSCTPSTMLVLVLQTTPSLLAKVDHVNSMASLMSTERLSPLMVLPVSTAVSVLPSSVSLSTAVCTLACTTRSSLFSWLVLSRVTSWPPSCSAGLSPPVPVSLPILLTPFDVV